MPTDKDALVLLAKRFVGIEAQEAEMTSVDRLGFHVRLKTRMACAERASPSCEKYRIRRRPEKCSSRWYGRHVRDKAAGPRECIKVISSPHMELAACCQRPVHEPAILNFLTMTASGISRNAARPSSQKRPRQESVDACLVIVCRLEPCGMGCESKR